MHQPLNTDRVIRRILRVNHAGERGAIAIYRAQISQAGRRCPDLLPWLNETLGHEQRHAQTFLGMMAPRGASPCPAVWIWKIGGAVLGVGTALLGRKAVIICTAAVERTVHVHLVQQIAYLDGRDDALAACIREVQVEEDAHLAFAEQNHDPSTLSARALSWCVAWATEILIWLATRGDSARLGRELDA